MSDSEGSEPTRRGLLLAAAGAVTAATAETAAAQDGNASQGGGETYEVDMSADAFEPDSITIAPGDTVRWINGSSVGHSVTGYDDEIPEGGSYFASGGWESEEAARNNYESGNEDSGFVPPDGEYSHTFQATGEFGYFCIPHEALGMTGTIEVVEGGPDTGGGYVSPVTEGFKTIGTATVGAMVAVLVFAYLFLKYGGLEQHTEE